MAYAEVNVATVKAVIDQYFKDYGFSVVAQSHAEALAEAIVEKLTPADEPVPEICPTNQPQ